MFHLCSMYLLSGRFSFLRSRAMGRPQRKWECSMNNRVLMVRVLVASDLRVDF